jgi:hypothetical protein
MHNHPSTSLDVPGVGLVQQTTSSQDQAGLQPHPLLRRAAVVSNINNEEEFLSVQSAQSIGVMRRSESSAALNEAALRQQPVGEPSVVTPPLPPPPSLPSQQQQQQQQFTSPIIDPIAAHQSIDKSSLVATIKPLDVIEKRESFKFGGEDSFLMMPSSMDADSVVISAWFYLGEISSTTGTMLTLFSNKKTGCAPGSGFALYVNEWETSDRQLVCELL